MSLFYVAIDFGTTYSGYAFASKTDLQSNPLTNICSSHWNPGDLMSEKTPTTLLLNANQEFVAFGYEAEDTYTKLTEEEQKTYYYFRRFKMMLYDKDGTLNLKRNTKLKDITDKEMDALDIFSHSIKFLKDHFFKMFKIKQLENFEVGDDDISWVLTVPAIWDDPAKQFMREAAVKAGIKNNQLMICLEPEAASVYCKFLPIEKLQQEATVDVMRPGRKYIVLDAGGGTIDMAVHQVRDDGKLQEIARVGGGEWGGIYVDKAFENLLSEIVGKTFIDDYRTKYPFDYLDLFRLFESKKRQPKPDKKVRIRIPVSFINSVDECKQESFDKSVKNSKYGQSIDCRKDKMNINCETFQTLYDAVADKIIAKVDDLLNQENSVGTDIILMVGGFSQCSYLQEKVKDAFPHCRVVSPPEPGLAVLRGALLFGYDPKIIAARVMKYTYGIGVTITFDKCKHPESKQTTINGKKYCKNVFDVYARVGDTVYINDSTERTYSPLHPEQTNANVTVYVSSCQCPSYTDEECKYVKPMLVPMPDTTGGTNRQVKVKFTFGGTEIKVEGEDVTTKTKVDMKIDFLGEDTFENDSDFLDESTK